jgi:hypothetical protein
MALTLPPLRNDREQSRSFARIPYSAPGVSASCLSRVAEVMKQISELLVIELLFKALGHQGEAR